LLSEGHFRLAQQQLDSSPGDWTKLAPAARLAWRQTLRQAALLADLSPEPLEEILRHAALKKPDEWLAEFTRRYQDKAIVFDAEFRRLPGASWTADYQLGDGPDRPRLIFDNLQVLSRLPGGEGQRLLLGVRLAAVRLEPPGPQWVIRFHADNGVLLTDRGAVGLLSPALSGPEVDELLHRQAKWVEAAAPP